MTTPGPPPPTTRFTTALTEHRLVVILRSTLRADLDAVVDTLVDAGVRCLEITLPTPGSLGALARARARHDRHALVGAGTVLTPTQVQRATGAGAEFLVSPHTDPELAATADRHHVPLMPGALTPTEILTAHRAGAPAVKLFPAGPLGPDHLTALAGPLPGVPLVPTGGIELRDVPAWFAAGAVAVAVGRPLLGDALDRPFPLTPEDRRALRTRAGAFVRATEPTGAHP
ncbi:bifunctional 4-hydroxy-2-oxoglutarate aldolase/2-dehydro-3-deoxy-phosphogluconate aldolase (plasmid) [Streptomyces sp. BI20]|uniref:bifunctional 4-hydroxy-2-oxoglutarate aldolase/2-dehydro-3-deoxy-phosphogluconate aldolase n=1 Tax=Streptomyces sp. BI20 TaxID=3403460 RepID=UPI003C73BAB2